MLTPPSFQNFKAISKLPFISKILEKLVSNHLSEAFIGHYILNKFQSRFHRMHSTKKVLLIVWNYVLMHRDASEYSVLVLLDLSAAHFVFNWMKHRFFWDPISYNLTLYNKIHMTNIQSDLLFSFYFIFFQFRNSNLEIKETSCIYKQWTRITRMVKKKKI